MMQKKSFDLCKFLGRDKKHLFQKLLPIEKVDTKELKFPMVASEKFDGVFCCAVKADDGEVHIYSRTGEEFVSMEHLKPALNLCILPEVILIFEAVIPHEKQNIVSGACRDTKKQHPEIIAAIHTVVELTSGNAHVTSGGCSYGNVLSVSHYIVSSLEEAYEEAEAIWKDGGEGLVLHAEPIQPYQPGKRNATIIKIKKGLSVDLEVIRTYPGKGKYTDYIGGLVCRYKDGKEIRVSGMTDAQRISWTNHPEDIVGKIVQIDAMGESAKGLLREPRFKGIRYDKEEADY